MLADRGNQRYIVGVNNHKGLRASMQKTIGILRKSARNILVITLISALAVTPLLNNRASALPEPSQWVGPAGTQVAVANGAVLSGAQFDKLLNSKRSIYGSLECVDRTLPAGPEESGEVIRQCWYDTELGRISRVGYAVHPKDEPYAGWREGFNTELFPTENSNVFIEIANIHEPGGQFIMFRTVEDAQLVVAPQDFEYPVFYKWAGEPTATLLKADGTPYTFDSNLLYSNVWYSNNGQWMVIWHDEGYLIRINLNDFSVLTAYGGASGYATGSITDDGRHVAINIFGTPLRMLDLESCESPPTTHVTEPVHCPIQFYTPQLNDAGVSNGIGHLPVFYDDNTLFFYTLSPAGSEYWEYILLSPIVANRTNYIALGDSFASGEGAGNYYESTNRPGENFCHLSRRSYPFILGVALELDDVHSVACSGARIQNIIGPEFIDQSLDLDWRTNQYKDVSDGELGSWAPGYNLQNSFLNDYEADIITISIGGNDMGFADIVGSCVKSIGTCFDSADERKALVNLINDQYERLVRTYKDLKQKTRPGSRIYVIGYPEIVKPGGNCGINVRLNSEETYFASNLTRYLNEVIRTAAQAAGVRYVDIEDALEGKRLCESDKPAVHGLNTAWNRKLHSPESYHPNAEGHDLMAQAINKETTGLTVPVPRASNPILTPDYTLAIMYGLLTPDEHDGSLFNGVIDYAYPPNQDIAIRGQQLTGSIASNTYELAANQAYELSMTSDPVILGTFMSDANGRVFYDVTIPADTQPGWHTLHLKGQTADGRPIDVRQNIYVAASEEDWDGDGILNEDAPCQIALPNETTGELDYNWCENPISPSNENPSQNGGGKPKHPKDSKHKHDEHKQKNNHHKHHKHQNKKSNNKKHDDKKNNHTKKQSAPHNVKKQKHDKKNSYSPVSFSGKLWNINITIKNTLWRCFGK